MTYLYLEGLLLESMISSSRETVTFIHRGTTDYSQHPFNHLAFRFPFTIYSSASWYKVKNNRNHSCTKITDQTRSE